MKFVSVFVLGIVLAGQSVLVSAQAPPPEQPAATQADDQQVVATLDGRPVTLREVRSFLDAMPAQNRAAALQNPEDFLRQYALMGKLTKVAEGRNLERESPYKEQLEYNRQMVLSTAGLNVLSQEVRVSDAEARSYFKSHQDDYAEVRVKVIYLPFLNTMPKPGEARTSMSESEALQLAEQLVNEIRGGADFVEKVKQHSKDEGSAKRDGEFATLKKSDQIPTEVKDTVFAMEEGEVSAPVRQANGFYIFRVEEKKLPSYDELAATLNTKVHDEKFRKKIEELRGSIDVQDIKADLLK